MIVQLHEHAKSHGIVHFQWVNCMVCEKYLSKVVMIKKT